jgi:hypothetical protein
MTVSETSSCRRSRNADRTSSAMNHEPSHCSQTQPSRLIRRSKLSVVPLLWVTILIRSCAISSSRRSAEEQASSPCRAVSSSTISKYDSDVEFISGLFRTDVIDSVILHGIHTHLEIAHGLINLRCYPILMVRSEAFR